VRVSGVEEAEQTERTPENTINVGGRPEDQPMWIREDQLMRALAMALEQASDAAMRATLAAKGPELAFAKGRQAAFQEIVKGMQQGRAQWIAAGCYSPFEHGLSTALDIAETVNGLTSFFVDVLRISQPEEWQRGFEPKEYKREILGEWQPTPMPAFERCQLPPPGWRCTRVGGHRGPCAAVEDGTPMPAQGTACNDAGCEGTASGDTACCVACERIEGVL
jgi:hypothetical protein